MGGVGTLHVAVRAGAVGLQSCANGVCEGGGAIGPARRRFFSLFFFRLFLVTPTTRLPLSLSIREEHGTGFFFSFCCVRIGLVVAGDAHEGTRNR